MGFCVTWVSLDIIITEPTCSTGSHSVIIVLAKFLYFVSTMDMLDTVTEIEAGRPASGCHPAVSKDDDDDDDERMIC